MPPSLYFTIICREQWSVRQECVSRGVKRSFGSTGSKEPSEESRYRGVNTASGKQGKWLGAHPDSFAERCTRACTHECSSTCTAQRIICTPKPPPPNKLVHSHCNTGAQKAQTQSRTWPNKKKVKLKATNTLRIFLFMNPQSLSQSSKDNPQP